MKFNITETLRGVLSGNISVLETSDKLRRMIYRSKFVKFVKINEKLLKMSQLN